MSLAAARRNDDKRVATDPGRTARLAGKAQKTLSDLLENIIACCMTERVVDFLEAVEVDKDSCDTLTSRPACGKLLVERFKAGTAVREARQRVMRSGIDERQFMLLTLRDIEEEYGQPVIGWIRSRFEPPADRGSVGVALSELLRTQGMMAGGIKRAADRIGILVPQVFPDQIFRKPVEPFACLAVWTSPSSLDKSRPYIEARSNRLMSTRD